jgi:CO dehydrogenase/acetyl-CoA synthase beta subunit
MTFLNTLISSKLAVAAIAAGVLSVGGVGAAAYAGILPTELQTVANEIIGTSATEEEATETDSALESDETTETDGSEETTESEETDTDDSTERATRAETGKSLFGLCNAFTKGGLSYNSTAFGSLVASIPTTETVEEVVVDDVTTEVVTTTLPTLAEFCATVSHPGKSAKFAENLSDDSSTSETDSDEDSNKSSNNQGAEKSNGKSESNSKSGSQGKSNSGQNGRP